MLFSVMRETGVSTISLELTTGMCSRDVMPPDDQQDKRNKTEKIQSGGKKEKKKRKEKKRESTEYLKSDDSDGIGILCMGSLVFND